MKKNGILNFVMAFLILAVAGFNANAQDFFGQLTHPSTSDAKFLKIMPTGKMYVGIMGVGIFSSTDEGGTWVSNSNGLTNKFVTDLTLKGSDMFISTLGGGIFKSTNYGSDWFATNNGLSELRVNTIFTYPNGTIFAGTYGNGVFLSVDNGLTWKESNKGLFWKDITSFAMSKAGFLIAGTNGGGIYRTQDTGKTWIRSSSGLKNMFITKLKSNNTNSSVFAGTNGRGVYQSANDGISWAELDTTFFYSHSPDTVPLPDLNVASIAFNSKNELVFSSRYGGIFFWDNDTYYSFRASDFMGNPAVAMDRHSNGTLYGTYPSNTIMYSTNNGEIWKEKNGPVVVWKNPKIFAAKQSTLFLFDSTGAIFRSLDSGKTWSSVKNSTKRINQMCLDSIGNIFAAADDGLWKSSTGGASWDKVFMSNDTTIMQVQTAPNGYIWTSTRYYKVIENGPPNPPTIIDIKRIFYSLDNGINWIQAPNLVIYKDDPAPKVLGINKNGDVYVSHGDKFWRSKNNGEFWTLSAKATSNEITGLGFTSSGAIFVTCTEGVFRSTNLGNTFDSIPIKSFNANKINITKNDEIYVHFSYNFIGSKEAWAVMRSTDFGNKWQMLNNSYNAELAQEISSSPDGDVYVSLQSGSLMKRVNPTTIAAPTLVDVQKDQKNVVLNPTFKWQSVSKAELYQIEVSEYDDFAYSWETMTQAGTEHTIQRNLMYNTKYYWRVRGKYHASNGAWSETRAFTTMLEAPFLKSPADDAIGVPVNAKLVWFKTNGATKYDIQVAKDSSFASPVFVSNGFADSTIITTQLEGLTNYYWRVKAKSDDAESYWSEIWSFKTVLGPPILIAPLDSAVDLDINITFSWHPAKMAKLYLIQFSEFNDFVINNEYVVTDTTYNSSDFNYFKSYFWRVRSTNDEGASDWSEVRTFTTGFEPPLLITPANNATNIEINTKYVWQKLTIADNYQIQVSKDENFADMLLDENTQNVDTHNGITLDNYEYYWWRIRAKTSSNTGVWAKANKFKTIVGVISLRIPENNALNQPIDLDFTWFNTKGAVKYHLQVANDSKFEDLIFSQDTLSDISMNLNILLPGKTYHWRVRAKSNEGFGAWSEVRTFTTGANIVVLKAPLNNITIDKKSVTFEWGAIPNATLYHLVVSENSDLSNPVLDKNDIDLLYYTYNDLEWDKTYYWHVKGIITGEETQWSQTWSFIAKEGGSVFDSKLISDMTISPNPAIEYLNTTFNLTESSNVTLKITDINGRDLVVLPLGFINSGMNKYELDVRNLSSGTFFVQLVTSQGIEIKEIKIVK